jgi:flap endonuclease GEN
LKHAVINKRNENNLFRGAKPRAEPSNTQKPKKPSEKGRTRFNFVLRQCEDLIACMGLKCVKGPGEAEAYCAYLNHDGLVDGVISQDSDCFAYGAIKVYRNFSVSTKEGAGGSVDVYDMHKVWTHNDIGQHKMLALALLCGCDYCPGVPGVGKESVLKFLAAHKNEEIMDRIRSWRSHNTKYSSLEIKVDDKSVCVNCGHHGKIQLHTKSGCSICRTSVSCDETLWRDQRLALKAELQIRRKALIDPDFPSQEVIAEFIDRPSRITSANFKWEQPKMVRFVKFMSKLLQWDEVYSFLKILPLLTRWQLLNSSLASTGVVWPREIKKERCPKGVPSYEIYWFDKEKSFDGLLSDQEVEKYFEDKPIKDLNALWSTIEPKHLVETAYPQLIADYLEKKAQKRKKPSKKRQVDATSTPHQKTKKSSKSSSLENISDLLNVVEEIAKGVPKKKQPARKKKVKEPKGLQMINKFMVKKTGNAATSAINRTVELPSDLGESDDNDECNMSDIINGIIGAARPLLDEYQGQKLIYEPPSPGSRKSSVSLDELNSSFDSLEVKENEKLSNSDSEEGIDHSFSNSTRTKNRFSVSHFFEPITDQMDCFEMSICDND